MEGTPINVLDPNSVNIAGVNIDIVKVFGDTLAERFLANISEEELNLIVENAKGEIWGRNLKDELIIKKTISGSSYYSKEEDIKIVKFAKNKLNDGLKELITEKIEEYTKSEEYQSKANDIVKEIIDYTLEGYKKDMIDILRKRLAIDPLTDSYENYIFSTKGESGEIKCRLENIENTLNSIVNRIYGG